MTDWLFPALCGLLTGILSSWGVGGGTLLLLCMTLFFGVEQRTAQAINLLYFLPTAGISLFAHRKTDISTKPSCARPSRPARSVRSPPRF